MYICREDDNINDEAIAKYMAMELEELEALAYRLEKAAIARMNKRYENINSGNEEDMMDEKKLEKLYELLENAENTGDLDAAAALRWAIFMIEQMGD